MQETPWHSCFTKQSLVCAKITCQFKPAADSRKARLSTIDKICKTCSFGIRACFHALELYVRHAWATSVIVAQNKALADPVTTQQALTLNI